VTLVSNSFNLVSSILPTSGDIVTNSLMNFTNAAKTDQVFTYSAAGGYVQYIKGAGANWLGGDPIITNVGSGVFYLNNQATNNFWTESFSVNQ